MTTYRNQPAKSILSRAIVPLFPPKAGWQLVEHEGSLDGDRTRVRVTQRSIGHSETGDPDRHLITFRITITVPTESLEDAEDRLDDDLNLFLFALDRAEIPWSTATKAYFTDEGGRLGYQLDDITIPTNPNEEMTNGSTD